MAPQVNNILSSLDNKYFSLLIKSREENARISKKKSMRGTWRGIIDKYPDSAHFIYELLQNADDVGASVITIRLTRSGMLFKHNGKVRFSITDPDTEETDVNIGHINSITSVGASTKEDNINKIGKFGVGFKAVFQYTQTPHIYDGYFNFKLEDYIVPRLLEADHMWRGENETLFWFPFDRISLSKERAYAEIEQKLSSLDNPILFLRNLIEIHWESEGGRNGNFSKKIKHSTSINDITCENISIICNDERSLLWLFTQEIEITELRLPISVGLYIDPKSKTILTDRKNKIYCFFPTRDKVDDLSFILHAPFELIDSRQNIKNNELNLGIIDSLAKLCADSLICLRDISEKQNKKYLDQSILNAIPRETDRQYWDSTRDITDAAPFYNAFKEVLSDERLILSQNGNYIRPKDCYVTNPKNLRDVVDKEQLNNLLGSDNKDFGFDKYTSAQSSHWAYIKSIGINVLTSEKVVELINEEFMKSQPIEWLHKFYRFVYNDAKDLWNIDLRNKHAKYPLRQKPIIRLGGGDFVSVDNSNGDINVFYPTKGVGFKCNFIDSNLLDTKSTEDLFKALGVKEPDAKDYIINVILPQYTKHDVEIDDVEIRDHLKTIYEYSQKCPHDERQLFLEKISNSLMLVGKAQNSQLCLCAIEDVYDDNLELRTYFSNCEDDIVFISYEFYHPILFEYPEIKNFIISLGINICPLCKDSNMHREYGKLCNMDECSVHKSIDYELQNLRTYLSSDITISQSTALWKLIALIPANYFQAIIQFRYYRGRTDYQRKTSAYWVSQLINSKWLYNKVGELKTTTDLHIEDLHPDYPINDYVINALGVKQRFQNELLASVPEEDRANFKAALELVNEGFTEEDILVAKRNKQQREQRNKQKERTKSDRFELDEDTVAPTLDDMFSDNHKEKPITKEKITPDQNNDLKNMLARQQEERDATNRIIELKASLDNYEKYSYKWFTTLLELEYKHSGEDSFGSKKISIQFSKVEKEENAERIYTLKSPSRFIPQALEEIGGLTVKFIFTNREDVNVGFEVANVKDYALRLKAKLSDSDLLSQIDFSQCNRAEVEIGNPTQLIYKLMRAYKGLKFNDDDNLKELLGDNLSFVFGPPGTGKTTYLSREIINLIGQESDCKILVLAPTNKACDVLANKIIENNDGEIPIWLTRFVATGDETLEKIGLVCNRESEIYQQDQCCVISTMARFPYDKFSNSNKETLLRDVDWDYIIVDEASMIPLHYITYTIYSQLNKPIIIAGDPFQITPIIREELWKDENIYSMVNLKSFNNPRTEPIQFQIKNLDTQYRSLPTIGNIFSDYTYDSKLKHHRESQSQKPLELDGVETSTVNFIPFKVEKYDSIFGAKKLSSSNIHIYSVLFTFEFVKFISSQIAEKYSETYRIGVICPYAAQAQLIEKLLEQYMKPNNVDISVGTIHGFQGDECDIVLAVFNPPKGIKRSAQKTFVNNKNIINVAISRARDYLFILMPSNQMDNYENLSELCKLGSISKQYKENCSVMSITKVEEAVFGERDHIENNTFVTTHQMANVYSIPEQKYEVRIDENAVDIQVNLDESIF